MKQQVYSLRSIGPTVDLQMIDIENWPVDGGASVIRNRSVTIGCDAPIVAAVVTAAGLRAKLVSNSISQSPSDPVANWLIRNRIESVSRSGFSTPTIIGIDLVERRHRTYLVPKQIDVGSVVDLDDTEFGYTYIDWYPEVRHWISIGALNKAAKDTSVWLNLARHSSDESIASVRGANVELIQLSVAGGRNAAIALSRRLFDETGSGKVVTTLGSGGSMLFDRRAGLISEVVPKRVVEGRSGAGAMFIGGFLASRMREGSWQIAHQSAADLASAFVGMEERSSIPSLDLF